MTIIFSFILTAAIYAMAPYFLGKNPKVSNRYYVLCCFLCNFLVAFIFKAILITLYGYASFSLGPYVLWTSVFTSIWKDRRSVLYNSSSITTQRKTYSEPDCNCIHCGAPLPYGSSFCEYCGSKNDKMPQRSEVVEMQPQKKKVSLDKKKLKELSQYGVYVLVIILLLLVVRGAARNISSQIKNDPTSCVTNDFNQKMVVVVADK